MKNHNKKIKFNHHFLLFLIILLGFCLRIIGLNWDQSQHLHPDERFLTMVSSTISLPKTIGEYFNTSNSTFNPSNNGFNFYVYGTFPLLITKIFANIFNLTTYDQIFLVGRFLSALFDSLTICLIFLISSKVFKNTKSALISSFFYAICIFPIQQSHFFTVDATTVFLFTLAIYLTVSQKFPLAGFIFGVALASKTSVGIILPLIFLFIIFKNKKFIPNILQCFCFSLFLCLSFRIFQPYAFDGLIKISPLFINNIHEAHQMITGEYVYPPNVQWQTTLPIIHPLLNLFFIGLGPIIFSLIILGIIKTFSIKKNLKNHQIILILTIILTIFIYHSLLLAKYMRYFYPIYPLLLIFSGLSISKIKPIFLKIILGLNLLFTFAFINIYLFPNSRYQASDWICQNIPIDSVLSSELWDDSLPLSSPSCSSFYQHQELSLYDPESNQKWQVINQKLDNIDYLILSSNRLWGSIPKNTQRYPITTSFYQNLFDNKTNFKLVKSFYSYPGFYLPFIKKCYVFGPSVYPYQDNKNTFLTVDPNCTYPGIYFRDDAAEESFTVYDHPQVLIFNQK